MERREVRVTSVRASTVAMFEGVFGLLIGLVLVIFAWLRATAGYSAATDSVLQGILLGLGTGFLALITIPVIYFIVGWVIGYIHGAIFNLVASWMGGIEFGTRRVDMMDAQPATQPATATGRRPEPTFGETVKSRKVD